MGGGWGTIDTKASNILRISARYHDSAALLKANAGQYKLMGPATFIYTLF